MTLLRRLLARLRLPLRIGQTPPPDCLNLREWADLPVHHPRCD